jgi:hypothetical protein
MERIRGQRVRKRMDEEGGKAACLSVLSINLRPELAESESEKNKQAEPYASHIELKFGGTRFIR